MKESLALNAWITQLELNKGESLTALERYMVSITWTTAQAMMTLTLAKSFEAMARKEEPKARRGRPKVK